MSIARSGWQRVQQVLGSASRDNIQSMLSPHGAPNIDRKLLAAKADEIDAQGASA